jgi:predicted DNA-binding protein (UPF0251 family)
MHNLNQVLEEDADLAEEDLEEAEVSEDKPLKKNKMPRPCRRRRVMGQPSSSYFKPAGQRITELEETSLTMPEFEAIRLIDFKEISQEEASKKMEISQPTLSRILKSARKKIADAIINGKAIKIE